MISSLLLVAVIAASGAGNDLQYSLQYRTSRPDSVSVTIAAPDRTPGVKTLVIPRALPTMYSERRYERYVEDVRAFDETGATLPVTRVDGPRWQLGAAQRTFAKVEYRVDIARMEKEVLDASESSRVRANYLSLLGGTVFAFFDGTENRGIQLEVALPADWPALSTLGPALPLPKGHLSVRATDYFELADSQIAGGAGLEVRDLGLSPPMFMAMYSEGSIDRAAQAEVAAQSMRDSLAYFGRAPFKHYTAMLEVLKPVSSDHGYNFSQEHHSSGSFYFKEDSVIAGGSVPLDRLRARYNFVHHFLHSWLPRRIAGRGNRPFSWELAPLIDTVWFSEGFAQYAALDAIVDTLPVDEGRDYRRRLLDLRFRKTLAESPPFIRRMHMVELSRVASTRYGDDFRTGAAVFSRGALMAAEIDDLIRARTQGKRRFRDVLRFMNDWVDRSGREFDTDEIPGFIRQATGVDAGAVFRKWMAPMNDGSPK